MSGKAERQDQAKELYQQAANCYKAGRDIEQAVECIMLCLDCEQDPLFQANYLRDAANLIKGTNSDRYLKLVKQALELFTVSGRVSQAASMAKDCAEKLEEDFNYELAVKMFD